MKFRNSQTILFSALGADVDQVSKLSDMICATLITQCETYELAATTKDVIEDIKKRSRTDIGVDDLLNVLIPGKEDAMNIDTSHAQAVWETIRTLFEDQAERLKQEGFFNLILQGRHNHDVMQHIYACLHEVPEEHQQLVFDHSLGHILPSTVVDCDGHRHILYNTGGTRWTQVTERSDGDVEVHIPNSLSDGAEAVYKHAHHLVPQSEDKGRTQWRDMVFDIGYFTLGLDVHSLWGDPPHDQFVSTALWADLVHSIAQWPGTANSLVPEFDDNFAYGVVGFLQCLQMERTQQALTKFLVQDESGWLKIVVWKGHIDSGSLLAWTQWYHGQDVLQVQLQDLTCSISASETVTRQQHEAQLRRLEHKQHNGEKLFMKLNIKYLTNDNPGCSIESVPGSSTDTPLISSAHGPVKNSTLDDGQENGGQRHSCCPCQ